MKELRSDFTDSLVHFTRGRTGGLLQEDDVSEDDASFSSLEVLCQILESGKILGSNNKGFVKGADTAVCFTECPLSAVKLFASAPEVEKALEESLHKNIRKKVRGYLPMKHLNQML